MAKIGLLFPGQGAQTVGMGKDFYEKSEMAKSIYDKANAVLGFDLKKIVFEGPEDLLKQTQYTQLAVFITSIAIFEVFNSKYPLASQSVISAGHSLGEYSSLYAAGCFNLEEGLKLVKSRGDFIQSACLKNPGTMAAIIGLSKEKLGEICKISAGEKICEMVNFNSADQIVIAGHQEAVLKAVEMANTAGAIKTVMLNVSGAFHSSLMNEASKNMSNELQKYSLISPKFSIITNCDAKINNNSDIKDKMAKQINSPVLWEETVKVMIDQGIDTFIEIGPGRVLAGLLKRIDRSKKSLNIFDVASLEKTVADLTNVLINK